MLDSHTTPDMDRWMIGHGVFFIQIQAIIVALHEFELEPTEKKLKQISEMLLSSAVMMRYAADFTDTGYGPIRDSMESHDPNFSGTFSADHAAMIRVLPHLKQAKETFAKTHETLHETLTQVYEAHSSVCEQFAGQEGSLANDNGVAWETIVKKFLPRALRKASLD